MYSPKELEEGVDHSFFDSDNEEEPSQDYDNTQSKQQSSGNDVVSHGNRSSPNRPNQSHEEEERMDDSLKVEDESIDLKEIKKAVSEVKDCSTESKKNNSSGPDSKKQNENGECSAGPAEGHKVNESNPSLRANVISRAPDEIQVNNASEGNAHDMKRTHLDKHDTKPQSNLKPNIDEENGSSINAGDRSQERSLGKLPGGTCGRYSRESPSPSCEESNLAESEVPPELESEGTVTDITPLSTPDMSPAQSLDLRRFALDAKQSTTAIQASPPPARASCPIEETKPHNVTIDLHSTRHSSDDEDIFGLQSQEISLNPVLSVDDMDRHRNSDNEASHCQVRSAREHRSVGTGSAQSDTPSSQQRRNYTFRDDEVWRIDRENQRLLRELSRPSSRPRSGNASTSSAYCMSSCSFRRSSAPQTQHLYHSATNRQREQKRIERENLALLKRIESVKPSISRAEQLADYQRQSKYRCTPPIMENYRTALDTPLSRSSQGRSSRPSSAGFRPSPRPASRPSPSPTKPSRSAFPRPAWT